MLQDLGAPEDDVMLVVFHLKVFVLGSLRCRRLALRRGFSRQHGFIGNARTCQKEQIASYGFLIRIFSNWPFEGHNVSGHEQIRAAADPFSAAVDQERVRFRADLSDLVEGSHPGSHHGAFKDHQHEQGEHGEVPHFVQEPECHAEHLEEEEGREHLLFEQLPEACFGKGEFVESVGAQCIADVCIFAVPTAVHVLLECFLGGKVQFVEARIFALIEEPLLSEFEFGLFVSFLCFVPLQVHEFFLSRELDGCDFDGGCVFHSFHFHVSQCASHVHGPIAEEFHEGLQQEDSSHSVDRAVHPSQPVAGTIRQYVWFDVDVEGAMLASGGHVLFACFVGSLRMRSTAHAVLLSFRTVRSWVGPCGASGFLGRGTHRYPPPMASRYISWKGARSKWRSSFFFFTSSAPSTSFERT
mmetsp:Transcript_8848/g.54442  ORF Transcript_8848/g.54442 Transcript_8848/m.54442 type:complete len:412 (-) Transcript_8848:31-1266(-)